MNETVTLLGAEEVSRAASRMQSAADQMSSAASSIDHTFEMFLRRYEELLSREMRVKEVVQEIDGVHYQLPITQAHTTSDGLVIKVGSHHG